MTIDYHKNREEYLKIFLYLASAVFLIRLVNFQILKNSFYRDLAERNRTQIIPQRAPRGKILTADGFEAAGNRPSYSLVYFPIMRIDDSRVWVLAKKIAGRLETPQKEILSKIYSSIKRNAPIKIADGLKNEEMLVFAELKTFYPGLRIITEARRFYPKKNFLNHVMGYMGKITSREWNYYKKRGYSLDSYVGKFGLEKRFEEYLKGTDGGIYLEVDSRGRLTRILESRKSVPGYDVRLTVNSKVQEAAEKGIRESLSGEGAVVALDPRSGKVLALASYPNFDADAMLSGELNKDVQEFNFAVQGTFPPGSIFKIVVLAAAMEKGDFSPEKKIFCPGYFDAGSRIFRCWEKKGHGRVDFYEGIKNSCDVYFYNLGLETGPYNIEEFSKLFGIGRKTGINLASESAGNVYGPAKRLTERKYWFIGDTLNLSIGQGELLVTPVQMAQMISAVANGGKFWKPYYVESVTGPGGNSVFSQSPTINRDISFKDSTWRRIRKGLRMVVESGTGRLAAIKGVEVYGKTGTAQNPHGEDHAWFVSYARMKGGEPEIAVAVLISFGKHGSSTAAPIARKVMEAAMEDEIERLPVGSGAGRDAEREGVS